MFSPSLFLAIKYTVDQVFHVETNMESEHLPLKLSSIARGSEHLRFDLSIIHILDIDIKQNLTGVLAYLHQQLKDKMMQMK